MQMVLSMCFIDIHLHMVIRQRVLLLVIQMAIKVIAKTAERYQKVRLQIAIIKVLCAVIYNVITLSAFAHVNAGSNL